MHGGVAPLEPVEVVCLADRDRFPGRRRPGAPWPATRPPVCLPCYYGGTFAGKRGSQRWIGPTEAYVACCHLGLKLVIAEWEKGKDGGAHGDAIYQHARRHFAGPDKGPIYHQRDGHSVTIFGTTADASAFGVPGTALLVCDPNVREGTLLAVGPATLDGRDHMLAYTVWNSAGERRLLRAGEAALEPVGVAA